MDISQYILTVPDFPKPGILFRDVTTLTANGPAYRYVTDQIATFAKEKGADLIVGPEARGFIVGAPVATQLGIGFVPIRKKGKLPGETIEITYDLEYGSATLEMHAGAIQPGQRVVITDDLLATGGTVEATIDIIEQLGGIVVGVAFIIELEDLKGREKFADVDTFVLLKY